MNRFLLVTLCLVAVQTHTIKKITKQQQYKLDLCQKKSDLIHFSVIANFKNETKERISNAPKSTLKNAYKKLKKSRTDLRSWLKEMEKIERFTKKEKKIFKAYMQSLSRIKRAMHEILKKVPSINEKRLTKYVSTPSRFR
jgi:hypothetical protein